MAEFVLNRNHTLVTLLGHNVAFLKGIPTFVPNAVIKDAIAIGAERIDAPQGDAFEEPKAPPPEPTGDERIELALAAFADLVASAKREDFTASGMPHIKAVKAIIGFELQRSERDALWQTYQERLAEEARQK